MVRRAGGLVEGLGEGGDGALGSRGRAGENGSWGRGARGERGRRRVEDRKAVGAVVGVDAHVHGQVAVHVDVVKMLPAAPTRRLLVPVIVERERGTQRAVLVSVISRREGS